MARSPYIERIRAAIGHDLLMMAAAGVLVVDDGGRVLLVRNRLVGSWGVIGGGIDPYESPADAARREAMEETGVDVRITALLGAYGGPEFDVTYENGDRVTFVSIVYAGVIVSGTPVADGDEISELGWFTPAEALALDLNEVNRMVLTDALPRLAAG